MDVPAVESLKPETFWPKKEVLRSGFYSNFRWLTVFSLCCVQTPGRVCQNSPYPDGDANGQTWGRHCQQPVWGAGWQRHVSEVWKWHLHWWAKAEALTHISMAVKLEPLAVCLFLLWELCGIHTCSQCHNISPPTTPILTMENTCANILVSQIPYRPKQLFTR